MAKVRREARRMTGAAAQALLDELLVDPDRPERDRASCLSAHRTRLSSAHRRARRLLDRGAPRAQSGEALKKTVAALVVARELLDDAAIGAS